VFEFFAFYKNFSLLCCFAGLGLGYSLASRDRIPLAAYSVTFFQAERNTTLELPENELATMGFRDCTGRFASRSIETDVSTDDWPFFYMPKRTYPTSYVAMIAVIVLISFFLISHFSQRPTLNHTPYFLLGAGFMLIETKGITEMGLTFGNTWLVIGIVISGILFMAFCANYLVMRLNVRSTTIPYFCLLGSLVFGLLLARSGGLPSSFAGQLGTIAVLTSPMLFSGIVFSSLLANERDIAGAMSANLFGAMCGGVLEYDSMYFGFQFLYILAAGLYAGAFLASLPLWSPRHLPQSRVPTDAHDSRDRRGIIAPGRESRDWPRLGRAAGRATSAIAILVRSGCSGRPSTCTSG
jgi:hypothetical protein